MPSRLAPLVRRPVLMALYLPLTLGGTALRAEESPEPVLPQVDVIAPAMATTVPGLTAARAAVAETAGGASVVDAADYREGRVSTPADALRYAPGVFVASRFGSEESRLSIRGSGLQRTFHGRGVMLLQDGVPLNLADGGVDFQAIEPLAAQYIEVYRGANALAHGATTLGGAIQYVSTTGRDAVPEVRLEGGSFGHQRLFGQLAAASDKADILISASHYARDGFQAHSAQDTQRLFANAGYRVSDTLEHRFFLAVVQTDSELPGSLTEQELRTGQTRLAAPGNITGDQKRDFDLWRGSYKLSWQPGASQRVEFSTFYSAKDLVHPIHQVLLQDSRDYGADLRWTLDAPFGRRRDELLLGARAVRGDTDDDRFANVASQPGARTDKSEQRAENADLYLQYRLGLADDWELSSGVQRVSALRDYRDLFFTPPADPDKSFSRRYEKWVPRVGLLFRATEQVQVYANASGVFEPPSFGELTGGPGVDILDAQEGRSLELGSRGSLGEGDRMGWDVTLYQADLKKELIAYQVSPGVSRTLNADRTVHRGVEAGFTARLLEAWQTRLSYQLNDFHFDDDASYGNNAIPGIPRQAVNAELMYRLEAQRAYIGPTITAASSAWVDHRNTLRAPGYAVYGLKLGQQLTDAISWFLEGRNLTDKAYAATTGVAIDASTPANQRLFNPGDGRSVYAGFEWRLR